MKILRVKIFESEEEFVQWQKDAGEIPRHIYNVQVLPISFSGRTEELGSSTGYKENPRGKFEANVQFVYIAHYAEEYTIEFFSHKHNREVFATPS